MADPTTPSGQLGGCHRGDREERIHDAARAHLRLAAPVASFTLRYSTELAPGAGRPLMVANVS